MSWRPALTGADAEHARAVALEVASRLTAREPVVEDRSAAGLASPDSSISLLCAQLDRLLPDAGWDRAGHVHLTAAAQAAERDGAPLGLFDGVAGLGFAAQRLAAGRPRYGTLLTAIDDAIAGGVAARSARRSKRPSPRSSISWARPTARFAGPLPPSISTSTCARARPRAT